MTTKPKVPKGARNMWVETEKGRNGYPLHKIAYWHGIELCGVMLQEDEFGELTVIVLRNSYHDGLKLSYFPLQAEVIQWFKDTQTHEQST